MPFHIYIFQRKLFIFRVGVEEKEWFDYKDSQIIEKWAEGGWEQAGQRNRQKHCPNKKATHNNAQKKIRVEVASKTQEKWGKIENLKQKLKLQKFIQ